jgi:hypothetical protein
MSDLVKAIQHILPNAEFTLTDDDYSTIVWNEAPAKAPTLAQIEKAKADIASAETLKANAKAALLQRLGINEEEATLLLS